MHWTAIVSGTIKKKFLENSSRPFLTELGSLGSSGYTEASWIRGKARREDQKNQVRGWLSGVARGGRCEQARQGRSGGGGVGNRSIR